MLEKAVCWFREGVHLYLRDWSLFPQVREWWLGVKDDISGQGGELLFVGEGNMGELLYTLKYAGKSYCVLVKLSIGVMTPILIIKISKDGRGLLWGAGATRQEMAVWEMILGVEYREDRCLLDLLFVTG